MKTRHIGSAALRVLVWFAAAITTAVMLCVVAYILIKGIPNLTPSLFESEYTSENVSMLPAIMNTVIVVGLTLLVAVPLGIFSAIYLTEYAKRGSRLVALVRMTAETLSGIPSIVYGLFGYLVFNVTLGLGYSLAAGIFTLSIMVLPTILRTTEESIKAVPDMYREGSFGLGAGRLRTVFRIVLPAAAPGILSGVILAMGRMVGETAALIFTAGTVAGFAKGLLSSGRTLSVHMYALLNEGLYMDEAYATAVILMFFVLGLNALSGFMARRFTNNNV